MCDIYDWDDPCSNCPNADYCDTWEAAVCPWLNLDADPWDIQEVNVIWDRGFCYPPQRVSIL